MYEHVIPATRVTKDRRQVFVFHVMFLHLTYRLRTIYDTLCTTLRLILNIYNVNLTLSCNFISLLMIDCKYNL